MHAQPEAEVVVVVVVFQGEVTVGKEGAMEGPKVDIKEEVSGVGF